MSSHSKDALSENEKLRVFVSSVQDELVNERTAIAELIHSDSFLSKYVEAVLFEYQPARTSPAEEAYLTDLKLCQVYIGIIGFEYGPLGPDGVSAIHREYLEAKELDLEILFFVRGHSGQDKKRKPRMLELFNQIRDNRSGHTYRRFSNYQKLKERVREALLPILQKKGIAPTKAEEEEFKNTVEAASEFDTQLLAQVDYDDLDEQLTFTYTQAVLVNNPPVYQKDVCKVLFNRGLIWYDERQNTYRPTAAGMLIFGKNPDAVFPQSRLVANAYSGNTKVDLIDRRDIRLPLPRAIQEAIQFLIRNMRHITKVRGFSRIVIDEYPYEALREALINAVAHRDYALRGSSLRVEKYSDRIVIMSPGGPPAPVTIHKIRSLNYTPCSRNPNIARALSYFERIEEQGDGIRRIVDEVRNMGLPDVKFNILDGHFTVTFTGPDKSLSRLRPIQPRVVYEVAPGKLDRLNTGQKEIMQRLLERGQVNVPQMAKLLNVTPQAVRKEMAKLQQFGLIVQKGKARATYYVLKEE